MLMTYSVYPGEEIKIQCNPDEVLNESKGSILIKVELELNDNANALMN